MAAFLTDAWLSDRCDPLAVAAAATGRPVKLQHVIGGGPHREVRFASIVDADGSVEVVAGRVSDPDVTFTAARADAWAILQGEMSPNVAYMRGRLKAAGHTGRVLDLLAAASGGAYEAARAELAARTDP